MKYKNSTTHKVCTKNKCWYQVPVSTVRCPKCSGEKFTPTEIPNLSKRESEQWEIEILLCEQES